MKGKITLNEIAGYATERTVWQMMLNLSDICGITNTKPITPDNIIIEECTFIVSKDKSSSADIIKAFSAPENASQESLSTTESSNVWSLGALSYYAITGMHIFEGRGGETQTETTQIPKIGSAHASRELSDIIRQCLIYSPNKRPTMKDIHQLAEEKLKKKISPIKKIVDNSGKSYPKSLIRFWPEEIMSVIILFILFLVPVELSSQTSSQFNKSSMPEEMAKLVLHCIDLRSSQNVGKVSKALDRDMNWTMMDELTVDKSGECTTKDKVDIFGLNDVGFSLLKRHGGVTNTGGRFRDGRDPRYKYSFIEITVKQNAKVNYVISGREGEQLFAIVPFDKNADFATFIKTKDGKIIKGEKIDGVCYLRLKEKIKKNDSFTLTLTNKLGKNMAFALINYNSRNHE